MAMKMALLNGVAAVLFLTAVNSNGQAADRVGADALLAGVPELLKAKDFKAAEEFCGRSLQLDDSCPTAHFYMGVVNENSKKMREALKSYQMALTVATKEKDSALATKASAAIKKLGPGLAELDALDTKFAEKLEKLGTEALEAGRLEAARRSFALLDALQPGNEKAKAALTKIDKSLEARGDPVKGRIASAMLSEVWYLAGSGKKSEAKTLAQTLMTNYADTAMGKEATALLERDFAAPKQEELAQLTVKAQEEVAIGPAANITAAPGTKGATPGTAAAPRVDVASVQKSAEITAKSIAKEALAATFSECVKKGKEFYSKATPGTEGNQENVAKALEQFIKADALYVRIEEEKLSTEELAAAARDSQLLHYACLKMTVLSN